MSAAAVRTRHCSHAGKGRIFSRGSNDTSGLVTCVSQAQLPRELCVISRKYAAQGMLWQSRRKSSHNSPHQRPFVAGWSTPLAPNGGQITANSVPQGHTGATSGSTGHAGAAVGHLAISRWQTPRGARGGVPIEDIVGDGELVDAGRSMPGHETLRAARRASVADRSRALVPVGCHHPIIYAGLSFILLLGRAAPARISWPWLAQRQRARLVVRPVQREAPTTSAPRSAPGWTTVVCGRSAPLPLRALSRLAFAWEWGPREGEACQKRRSSYR